jgi:hypothetical protein
VKNKLVTKCHTGPQTWTDSLDKRAKLKKMDMRFGTCLREIGWVGMYWIDLAQDKDRVNTVVNLWVS